MPKTLEEIALPLFFKHINKYAVMETDVDEVMAFVHALIKEIEENTCQEV